MSVLTKDIPGSKDKYIIDAESGEYLGSISPGKYQRSCFQRLNADELKEVISIIDNIDNTKTITTFDMNAYLAGNMPDGQVRGDYLCFLLVANEGWEMKPHYVITTDENNHQKGLHPNEFLDLVRFHSFVDGLEAAGVKFYTEFLEYFRDYRRRWGKE